MVKNGFRRVVLAILLVTFATATAWAQLPLKSAEFVPGSWTMVLLPDTQFYALRFPACSRSKRTGSPRTRTSTTFAMFLGWATSPTRTPTGMASRPRNAFAELDGRVPYALASGNHDYTPHGDSRRAARA